VNYRDDEYRAEYEALLNQRHALAQRPAGHGPLTLAATVAFVVAAVLLLAWWVAS